MKSSVGLVFYYNRENRYGFNALLGALENEPYFENLSVYLPGSPGALLSELGRICGSHEKVVLGVSFFTPQLWDTVELVRAVREQFASSVLLIAGGPHPTGDPRGTLDLGFDIVVRGEGEKVFCSLLKRLDQKLEFDDVPGISFYKKGIYAANRKAAPLDLNEYTPFSLKYEKFGPLELTRGCTNSCYYCQTPRIFSQGIRHRSIDRICAYITQLLPYGYNDVRFITPDAFCYNTNSSSVVDISSLEKLLTRISGILPPEGRIFIGSFPSEIRPEHVSPAALDLVKQFGANKTLVIGGQSGSDQILEMCRRNHTVSDIYNAVKLACSMGFEPSVDFIFGLPFESEQNRKETARVMEDLIGMGAKIHGHTFVPLPQTPFSREYGLNNYKSMVKFINKLIHRGVIFGQWEKQALLAEKIYTYLKYGKL